MKLTTGQVSDILKVGPSVITRPRKEGRLTDTHADIKSKHTYQYNSKQVNILKKENNFRVRSARSIKFNGEDSNDGAATRFVSRLENTENKIDKLIRMWS